MIKHGIILKRGVRVTSFDAISENMNDNFVVLNSTPYFYKNDIIFCYKNGK